MLPAKNREKHLAVIYQAKNVLKSTAPQIESLDEKLKSTRNYIATLEKSLIQEAPHGTREKIKKEFSDQMSIIKKLNQEMKSLDQKRLEALNTLHRYFPNHYQPVSCFQDVSQGPKGPAL